MNRLSAQVAKEKTGTRGEFIEDRSIETPRDDSFRHEDVVTELAGLAANGPAPSNIALFAPWGTGKTGIAKLLRPKIESAGQRFVYFDAFKHRDTPLRRSFLRTATAELAPSQVQAIDSSLYGQEVRQELDPAGVRRLAGWIIAGIIGALLLTGLVSFALADLKPGPNDVDFPRLFASTGGVLALVGALTGVAITTLVSGLAVTKTSTPVAEDDEFEREFGNLVEGSNRVVVFIDELDRCSADDVVEALETMRVFLDTANCVFLVAVDQQTLEQALRRKARQETPVDETHPYFSSTGSYIDKIFQYQLALPPLRSRDMTVFIRELTEDRPGLWEELRERGEFQDVIGALAPTHLTSPRRSKVLLNSFVMAYRLAKTRVDAKQMRSLDGRCAALAQLVCLRTEFPLFADELDQFPRLPQALRTQHRQIQGTKLESRSPKTWERARQFKDGELPIAPLLFRPAPSFSGELSMEAQERHDFHDAENKVASRHLQNLIGYLERVERLPQITEDLVFLHSAAGSGTKLEPQIADQLADAARDGSEEQVTRIIEEIEEAERPELVHLLISILSAADPASLDARNAAHVLLAATASGMSLVSGVADEAAGEIARQSGFKPLEDVDLPAAIALSKHCTHRKAETLLAVVSYSDDVVGKAAVRSSLIESYPGLPETGASLATDAVARAVREQDEDALTALATLEPTKQRELIKRTRPLFEKELERQSDPTGEPTEGEPEFSALTFWKPRLEWALSKLISVSTPAAVELAVAIFWLNKVGTSDIVRDKLVDLGPVSDNELRRLVLLKARERELGARTGWLIPLAAEDIDAATAQALERLVAQTWEDIVDGGGNIDESLEHLLAECFRLADGSVELPTDAVDAAISSSMSVEAVDSPDSEWLSVAATLTDELVKKNFADRGIAASSLAKAAGAALAVVPSGDPNGRPKLVTALDRILPTLPAAQDEALQALLTGADAAPADTIGLTRLRAKTATVIELRHRSLPTVQSVELAEILAQIDVDKEGTLAVIASWVDDLTSTGAEVWAVLDRYWDGQVPDELRRAAQSAAGRLGPSHHESLARHAFDRVLLTHIPDPANWEAISLRSLPPTWVIDELAKRSKAEGFGEQEWRTILEICKQLTVATAPAQRRIGKELLLPLAREGDTGFRLAVDHLGLVGKGTTATEIVEALGELANTDERRALLRAQLDEGGWSKAIRAVRSLFGAKEDGERQATASPTGADQSEPSVDPSGGTESESSPDGDEAGTE